MGVRIPPGPRRTTETETEKIMTTATPARRSRRMPKIQNGRYYAALITIVFVVSQICQTVTTVASR